MKKIHLVSLLIFCFILASCMATPTIRLNAGGLEMELTQPVPIPASADLSADGSHLLIGGWKESGFKLWDINKGELVRRFFTEKIDWNSPIQVVFTPDGRHAVSGGKQLKLWDLSSGAEIRTIGDLPADKLTSFSADGSRVVSCFLKPPVFRGWDAHFLVWNASTWNLMARHNIPITSEVGLPSVVALSPDGKHILTGHFPLGMGGQLKKRAKMVLWDADTGEILREVVASEGFPVFVPTVNFSPDGKRAVSGGLDGTLRLWDIPSGRELEKIKAHPGGTYYAAFSRDGRQILSGGVDGLLKVWDASSLKEIKALGALSGDTPGMVAKTVGYAAITADGKKIVSGSTDAAIRIWNSSTGEEMALLIGFEDGEWLAITAEGYYNSSEKGAQYLKTKFEGKDFTVDQFYDVFYRPDIVAAKLRGEDIKGLVTITMQDAIKSPPPLVEFTSQTAVSGKAKVCYQVRSAGGGIGEVRLFHNGKLIQSDGFYKETARVDKIPAGVLNSKAIYAEMRSVAVKGKAEALPVSARAKGDLFEDCREIDAVPGENELSLAAFNSSNTVQSALKTVSFTSGSKPEEPHLYILAVGIDRYRDSTINLKYAVKDAKDFEEKIRTRAATIHKPQNIHFDLLTDAQAGKAEIISRIDGLSAMIKPQDSFILFVAGHGVLLQNQYYMLTHDYDGSISDAGLINSNEIVEMSKKVKSLSQLFIFDTCHAGGVDTIVSGLYDARMSVLARKMGLHIYASASDKQAAMDGYKGNGLFTYTLLDGLNNNKEADINKDGKVTVVGLGEYSKKKTALISKQIGHEQTPLIINFGKDNILYKLQ